MDCVHKDQSTQLIALIRFYEPEVRLKLSMMMMSVSHDQVYDFNFRFGQVENLKLGTEKR